MEGAVEKREAKIKRDKDFRNVLRNRKFHKATGREEGQYCKNICKVTEDGNQPGKNVPVFSEYQ